MSRASINRSAAFTWSPAKVRHVYLATGTLAGALDESFSNEARLEIWDPFAESADEHGSNVERRQLKGSVTASSKFSRLAWGFVTSKRPLGVIAAGMENGELAIWDPEKILRNASASEALIWSNTQHNGPIRGLDFNPSSPHLLATGANSGEIWVWDLNTPQKPYSPGSRSRNLEDITSLAWNRQVPHILATASSSGYTVVWDLKGRKEIAALNFNASQNNTGQAMGGPSWMGPGQGVRRGISSVAWHPDNPTRLATASEDDMSPVVMVWDLRNTRQPEKVLSGHEKGILGMEWCTSDSDLLLTCGKDSRNICWNPNTGTIVAELSRSTNWAFETHWAPKVPDLVAVGSYEGKVEVHSLQSTRSPAQQQAEQPTGADIFEQGNLNVQSYPAITLSQAPKWLKRPTSAAFGFGGKLISAAVPKAGATSIVKIHQFASETEIRERATELQKAILDSNLSALAEGHANSQTGGTPTSDASWKLLLSLFRADSRDELITLLGFSKTDVKDKVAEAIKTFKERSTNARTSSEGHSTMTSSDNGDDSASAAREPLVTFADTHSASSEGDTAGQSQQASSERSISALSESTAAGGTAESEITEPSLWDDDQNTNNAANTNSASTQAAVDFYSSISSGRPAALPDHLTTQESFSVAATAGGSRPSSVASADQIKANTFKIYPADESDADRLITRALILGDFASAVSLCLSADRFADALLLAVKGGPELLAETQKTYFERQTTTLPYLRLFQSIASNDLSDIVQNADLAEWQEVFVVLCTFAKQEEFADLVKQLGQRLEFQHSLLRGPARGSEGASRELRQNALLCYLAAGKLDKAVGIWNQQLKEEETKQLNSTGSNFAARAKALQTFVEKVAVFQAAVKYTDDDLQQPTSSAAVAQSGARTYKLASLYDRYREYAELLATQGMLQLSLAYLGRIPVDYRGPSETLDDALAFKTRIAMAAAGPGSSPGTGNRQPATGRANYSQQSVPQSQPVNKFTPYGAPPTIEQPYAPSQTSYAPQQQQQAFPPQPAAQPPPPPQFQQTTPSPYAPAQYGQPVQQQQQQPSPYGINNMNAYQPTNNYGPIQSNIPNIPPPMMQQPTTNNTLPPPPKRTDQGWNDAPNLPPPKRTGSALSRGPIASPFPGGQPMNQPHQAAAPSPPSRLGAASPAPQNSGPPPPRRSALSPPPIGASSQPPSLQGSTSYGSSGSQYAPQQLQQSGQYNQPQVNGYQQQYAPNPAYAPNSNAYAPQQQPQSQYMPSASSASMPPPARAGSAQQRQSSGNYAPQDRSQPNGMQQQQAPPSPKPEVKQGPPPPKYPAGDRSHIPQDLRPIYDVLYSRLQLIRDNTPPQQKKMVDDTERRLNVLFDALNCETLSDISIQGLQEIVQAVEAHDPDSALDAHLRLLTSGPAQDKLTAWMPAVKIIARVCGH